ncbi:uncharacterized protein LACBIDRAFT_296704 [Laccaria bicolor S238N-H82]|uniref:Predicted protein n=1 Tax=Laccaria bicolor (strain S238N-H82 / ATCC MYA-4686) TaxID=486041 RepID=B0D845_LACBS|nr:uncharacterized protein LACBIDRAFT_296704 [Laccaria bicolor S238N-H82]EDR09247.1 predicted protein [Laccaria bicolor S238N-H82]|eukprot:XP_001880560.1 predicted protein [Laccaria bicolor S238N-H82]
MRCVDRVWACCRVSGLPCLGIFARCVGRVSSFGWLHVASHLGVLPLRLLCHVSRVYASVAYSRCQLFGWLHVASRLGTLPSRLLCRSLVSGHFRVHTRQARRVNAASTRLRGVSTREAGREWGSGPRRFQKLFGNCCNALAYLDITTSITVTADVTLTGKFRKV